MKVTFQQRPVRWRTSPGAGDTVVAALALALAAGADIVEAAALANAAAGVSVSKFGPSSVTPAELSSAFGSSAR